MELEQLHSYAIIEIMKFCDVESMLRFSETSKRYNEIMSSSAELTRRICFNMKPDYSKSFFKCLCNVLAMLKSVVSHQRKYTKAKMAFEGYYDNDKEERNNGMARQFRSISIDTVEVFGKTITDFDLTIKNDAIFDYDVDADLKRVMQAIPNVKKLSLKYYDSNDHGYIYEFGVLDEAQLLELEQQNFKFMASVKDLKIEKFDHDVLQLFRDCTNLKSFDFKTNFISDRQNAMIDNFLAKQIQLKHLKLHFYRHDSDEEDCQLEFRKLANIQLQIDVT